ncbi:hypothetical protein [Geodermatophilus marinus]|uniref:hypothetical protein n=1 Tax=Geodermatophilus sp. LHW52908 TaxID=2303986 RepID=UPI000E3BC54C|nr:hypothetical protein [Geodermatophilus sp. LHW52908]RFU23231.1 hypothetical protein D0Z06_00860 [Geodermatophilus sp. LHW52908]
MSVDPRDDLVNRDAAAEALRTLVTALGECGDQLVEARRRAEQLLAQRETGRSWLEIVSAEERPLVVERISSVMGTLATAGGAWRREQAHALQAEQVSINRIAALYGVTRQRISALLRERPAEPTGA